MKITKIELYKADLPFHEPFRIAIMEVTGAKSLFVRVHTDDGLYGMGEANPYWAITGETQAICLAASQDLAKLLLGKDPLDIESRTREMNRFLAHNSTAKSAFDMALYDILGKVSGKPLYALLGGPKRAFWTDNTIGISDATTMAGKAVAYTKQGFNAVKVKLGTTQHEDVARIRAIREAIGPETPIRIDANQGWDQKTAASTLKEIEQYGIEYAEQPVAHWDHAGLASVRRQTSIPIMADESLFDDHDAYALASGGCCDYFNIKLAKSGGIHTALRINAIGEGAGIACMLGCMTETRLGLTAAAHVVSARPNIRFADLDGYLFLKEDPVTGGARYNVGEITLPDEPGIGADIDAAYLASCDKTVIS